MTLRVKLAKNLNGCFPIFSVYQRKVGGAFQFSIKCPKQTETSYFERDYNLKRVGRRLRRIYTEYNYADIWQALRERWHRWQMNNCQGCENTIPLQQEGEG